MFTTNVNNILFHLDSCFQHIYKKYLVLSWYVWQVNSECTILFCMYGFGGRRHFKKEFCNPAIMEFVCEFIYIIMFAVCQVATSSNRRPPLDFSMRLGLVNFIKRRVLFIPKNKSGKPGKIRKYHFTDPA